MQRKGESVLAKLFDRNSKIGAFLQGNLQGQMVGVVARHAPVDRKLRPQLASLKRWGGQGPFQIAVLNPDPVEVRRGRQRTYSDEISTVGKVGSRKPYSGLKGRLLFPSLRSFWLGRICAGRQLLELWSKDSGGNIWLDR